ncbi:MAG TPA: CPBP family intramembrane glutamic endopeptidase [Caulobacteraceae bacterium]|jgi:hypothetical protein
MNTPGLWAGLGESIFLANIGERERSPTRLVGVLIGGLAVGIVAATCITCLTMIPLTLALGHGSEGIAGLGAAASALADPNRNDLTIQIGRLVVTTFVDDGLLLVFAAFAAAAMHRQLRIYATAAPRIRWRLVLVGLALATLALTPLVTAQRVLDGAPPLPILSVAPDLGGRVLYVAAALLLIPAAAVEELVFRGWLLRQIAAFNQRPLILIGLSAIIFAAAHFDFSPDAFLTRALMGAGLAYMTLRLGGIEFAVGAHAANNLLIVLFLQPLSVQSQSEPVSMFELITDAALLGGYFIATEAVVRWPWLRRLGDVRPAEISPPDNLTTEFG